MRSQHPATEENTSYHTTPDRRVHANNLPTPCPHQLNPNRIQIWTITLNIHAHHNTARYITKPNPKYKLSDTDANWNTECGVNTPRPRKTHPTILLQIGAYMRIQPAYSMCPINPPQIPHLLCKVKFCHLLQNRYFARKRS